MIIEPTPALPPSRGGRMRMLAAVAAPLLLLVVAVGSGAIGRALAPDPPTIDPMASSAARTAEASPQADPMSFPPRILGLPTRTVAATLDLRRDDRIGDEVVAIRGWLTIALPPADCLVQPAGLCARPTILADTADPILVRTQGEVEWLGSRGATHLHPVALAGVSLPDAVDGLVPLPVVVLGRFDDPRLADPRTSPRHPNVAFSLERVVWADGARLPVGVVWGARGPADGREAADVRALASAASPGGAVVLGQALVDLTELGRIDPTAAGRARVELERIGRAATKTTTLWFVRLMIRDGMPVDTLAGDTITRRLGWVVMTIDGAVLAAAMSD
ncbi:MAG: hypothetical protein WEG56_00270 [Chloroflexota bacterium]